MVARTLFALLCGLFVCGCGSSRGGPVSPAQAQPATMPSPVLAVDTVVVGGRLPNGEVLDLDLEVTGQEVRGLASLTSPQDIHPFGVSGEFDGTNYYLSLEPNDVGDSDALELSGSLKPGRFFSLTRPGASEPFARCVAETPPQMRLWDRTIDGNENEEYELYFTGKGPVSARNPQTQEHVLRLKFNERGFFRRWGTWEYISKSPVSETLVRDRSRINEPQFSYRSWDDDIKKEARVAFGLTTTVRIDLWRGGRGRLLGDSDGAIWARVNDNSFFSAGIVGQSVGLDPDSYLETFYWNWDGDPQKLFPDRHVLRPTPPSYLKIVNNGI